MAAQESRSILLCTRQFLAVLSGKKHGDLNPAVGCAGV